MNSDHEILGFVHFCTGQGGLERVEIETPWSTAEIYLHGAHVTAFRKMDEPPLLFLSSSSEFAPGKAIRGGIPVIFPWFGPRDDGPAHGFARVSGWAVAATDIIGDGAVEIRLVLPPVPDFHVELTITVSQTLDLELRVTNTSDREISFENCFHTYLEIADIHQTTLAGLQGAARFDKITGRNTHESPAEITITAETDRIYADSSPSLAVSDPGHNRRIRVAKSGSVSTVVWNPWIAKSKAMPDFGDDEYLRMLCVESGNVADGRVTLPPGGKSILRQTLSSEPLA